MAEGLTFDDLDPAWKPPRPGEPGAPTVPISKPQASDYALAPPKVPRSGPQASDYEGLTFDDLVPPTEAQKSVARIREIAKGKLDRQPYTPGPLDHIDAFTYSLSRPFSAAIGTGVDKLMGNYPNASANEIYQANIAYMNDRARQAEKNTPFAPAVGAIAQLPVAMATGGGSGFAGVGKAAAPATTRSVAGRAAAQGAVEGAAQNADTPMHAIEGGIKSGLISGGTAGALDLGIKAGMPAARRGAEAEATAARGTPPDEVRTRTKDVYTDLDNKGIAYDDQQTAQIYTGLHKLRDTHVYVPSGGNAKIDTLFDDLMSKSRREMTFNELDDIRSAIATEARGKDESTRVAARAMLNEIDQLVGKVKPAINPTGVDVGPLYEEARKGWKAKSLVEDALWHSENVDRKAAVNAATDPNTALKGEFAGVEKRVNKPGNYNPYTDEQRDLLSRIVRGDKGQNARATVGNALSGRFAPWAAGAAGLGVPSMLGISKNVDPVLGYSMGALSGALAGGATDQLGKLFNRGAANAGERNVAALMRDITGSATPVPGAAIDRGDLAKILFAQDLARLAPRMGSQLAGNPKKKEEKK